MIGSASRNTLAVLGGIFVVLVISTIIATILTRRFPDGRYKELFDRVKSWWIMATIFGLALVVSPKISIAFFAFLSFLAMKEFFSLIPTRRADRRVLFWAYLSIPLQYWWVYTAWYGMFIIFIPVYMFLLIPLRMVLIGETDGFLKAAGTIHWSLVITVFSLSHAAFLLALPPDRNPAAGGAGLLLFLVLLTQGNDVTQYVWGKSFGRRKIVPTVSPNKTWAGFLGGVITTTILSVLLAPVLTPFSRYDAVLSGVLIGLFGFIGDITLSSVKRDIGVKDASSLIPGHGGIMDRLNSLTYTAPLFFHMVYYLYY